MELKQIVPEYHSPNPLVRWVFRKRLDIALQLLGKPQTHSRVLDIGCGEGLLLKMLYDRFPGLALCGIDINDNVRHLNGQTPILFVVWDIEYSHTTFKPDVIFCLDVLEHLQRLGDGIGNIAKCLRVGGYLITSCPTESLWYKLCRFLYKGKFSEKTAPASSPHLNSVKEINRVLSQYFRKVERHTLLGAFQITKWQKRN